MNCSKPGLPVHHQLPEFTQNSENPPRYIKEYMFFRCTPWSPFSHSFCSELWKIQFSSVQSLSHVQLFATPWIAAHQASLSITNSRSSLRLSRWCHPAISSSVVPFSSCPQSLPASESFPMSQLFAWGDQSIGVSALASVLPMDTQDWSPLEWTGWISLQSKGLSRVFSNTTVQEHQFFSAQLSSPNRLLEISGEITPERMKGWSQSKNNTQLWMWLVIEAGPEAVKSNIA